MAEPFFNVLDILLFSAENEGRYLPLLFNPLNFVHVKQCYISMHKLTLSQYLVNGCVRQYQGKFSDRSKPVEDMYEL